MLKNCSRLCRCSWPTCSRSHAAGPGGCHINGCVPVVIGMGIVRFERESRHMRTPILLEWLVRYMRSDRSRPLASSSHLWLMVTASPMRHANDFKYRLSVTLSFLHPEIKSRQENAPGAWFLSHFRVFATCTCSAVWCLLMCDATTRHRRHSSAREGSSCTGRLAGLSKSATR